MADIFYHLENNRNQLNIESFTLSQTTLEQVFMNLAEQQDKKNNKHLIII